MDQIVVKTELQNNGEILLYYVDENGENQQGIVTSFENVENSAIQDNYVLNNLEEFEEPEPQIYWSDEETKRLLTFYIDNKQSFLMSGATQRTHLLKVACKTILVGKDHENCDFKLQELKSKYIEVRGFTEKGVYVKWEFLNLCHQAFHDNITTKSDINTEPKIAVLKQTLVKDANKVVKQINRSIRTADEKVELMLNLYLKYKHKFQQEHWRRDLWDTIALEMGGSEDGEYWQKRFLNYKQHYVTVLTKLKENSSHTLRWAYMDLFDKIFQDDPNFHKKYFNTTENSNDAANISIEPAEAENEWNCAHITILGKYYFDSYEEFEDPTIPNMFLWTEVGRLINKKPETCKQKYSELRDEHIKKYLTGGYKLQNRLAIDIILDNIIAKDVKKDLANNSNAFEPWKAEEKDMLVKFFFDNIEIFKDSVCYFVCWEAVAMKVHRDVESCKDQWDELVTLYNSILEDKKDDSDMEIDWRYIEMFDRIFDFGIDVKFMEGYGNGAEYTEGNIGVKKITINSINDEAKTPDDDDQSTTSPRTDPRSTKILEFYLKNKDKFLNLKNKLDPWKPLAKEIDFNSTQCAHRFRHLRQTYYDTVQKEIDAPKSIITWPYYNLCKKVFGYRIIKNQLKRGTLKGNDWLARELKQLITFFSKNYHAISSDADDITKWEPLAIELGKSEIRCKEKFLELRKCYRKLKTEKTRKPDKKISWSHFAMFDRIYSTNESTVEDMEVETLEEEHLEMDGLEMDEAGEEDYQCIIVMPEGQELTDISNARIVIENPTIPSEAIQEVIVVPEKVPEQAPKATWTKSAKKLLLIHYINYMRSHRGKKINQKQLWDEIATKIKNKTHGQCKKMFNRLYNTYKNYDEEKQRNIPLHSLMEKVLKVKPKTSISPIKDAKIQKTYKDVEMSPEKVEKGLEYYLDHIDDFVDPKFEKTFLWTELANHISEPVNKVYNKINYLKQAFNVETGDIDGQKSPWSVILNDIIVKEVSMKVLVDETKPCFDGDEINWSEDNTESLLTWYLKNLDKFKNPKYNRSYLWLEASTILSKSPLSCSKKMSEIRTLYRNMVRNNDIGLNDWRFLDLCQKIYGTGKKNSESEN